MRVDLKNINIELNTNSTRDNFPEIERHILVMEERARACCHTLPFKRTHKVILVAMLMNYEMWLNTFPPKGGVSTSVITCTILTGVQFDKNKHWQIKFSSMHKCTKKTHQPTAKAPGLTETRL